MYIFLLIYVYLNHAILWSKTNPSPHNIPNLSKKSVGYGFSPNFNTNSKILGKSINHSEADYYSCYYYFVQYLLYLGR